MNTGKWMFHAAIPNRNTFRFTDKQAKQAAKAETGER
jgi:hypothetical protein